MLHHPFRSTLRKTGMVLVVRLLIYLLLSCVAERPSMMRSTIAIVAPLVIEFNLPRKVNDMRSSALATH